MRCDPDTRGLPYDRRQRRPQHLDLPRRDYDLIVQVIDRWWGGPTSALAHPIFFYELGEMARIVEDNGVVVGFLLGFIAKSSRDGDVGYLPPRMM